MGNEMICSDIKDMDIKLGGREMATVVYSNEEGDMCSLVIDGEEYVEDEERAIIPKAVLKQIRVEDIPDNFQIEVCESKDSSVIMVSVPMTFVKVGKNEFQVIYDELITRKYWDGPIGLKLYMETKRDVIEERSKEVGDVHLENYDDDGAYIHLAYSTKIYTDDMSELLSNMEQIYGEIEGATDITLGSPFSKIDDCAKENEFTIKILLSLFRKLGFANVKYNHGNKEFGKDITFARRTEFDDYEYYGVQVKYGDVSGGTQGEINELIQQAKDSFSMPYYDVYSRNKVRVSKVIIAISGKFTQNAVEKIIEGVTEYPLKNNLIFLDKEKIEGLMSKYNKF